MGDFTGDQAIKEREEKDTKIQTLEKHLERQREELRKEKEDNRMEKSRRLKSEKAIKDSFNNVEQEKIKYVNELEKYRQAIKQLSEDLEKRKHADNSLPEGTSVLQLLSGTALDDIAAGYISAVEDFERAASAVSSGLGARSVSADTPVADTLVSSDAGRAVLPQASRNVTSVAPAPATATSPLRGKAPQDNEKRPTLPRTGVETRKMGRKLVRPRLGRLEEPQGDVEMSEIDGSNTSGKPASSQDTEAQGNLILQTHAHPVIRKRLASTSEVQEDPNTQVESSGDVAAPVQKKSKSCDTPRDGAEGHSSTLESAATLQAIEESSDAVGDLPQGSHDDIIEPEKELETTEKAEVPKESEQLDRTGQDGGDRTNVLDENLDDSNETDMVEDGLTDQAEQDNNQQAMMESGSEKEEGELIPDVTNLEGGSDMPILMESPETGDRQLDPVGTAMASPTRVDEEAAAADFGEINSPEALNDDKNEGEVTEETGEGSDKSNHGNNDQVAVETDQVLDTTPAAGETMSTTTADASVSNQASSDVPAEAEEVKPVSPVSSGSTIVISERARERAVLRQAGVTPSPSFARGRGRATGTRGRLGRGRVGPRSGRGQAPPDGQG